MATITKGPKKLIFTGTATNKISLAGVTQCPATADHKDMAVYQGPVFEELDPQVQVNDRIAKNGRLVSQETLGLPSAFLFDLCRRPSNSALYVSLRANK